MNISEEIALKILKGFNYHFRKFDEITAKAQQRFEAADWKAERQASRSRITLYDKRVDETVAFIKRKFSLNPMDETIWTKVKTDFILLLQDHQQPELAETFYNSVFCRAFTRELYTSKYIFVRNAVSTVYINSEVPTYEAYYPANTGFYKSITSILTHFKLEIPFENFNRDKRYIARSICKIFKKGNRTAELNFQYQVINALFYRNKAAYIVGKAINGHDVYPFAIPLLNNEKVSQDKIYLEDNYLSIRFNYDELENQTLRVVISKNGRVSNIQTVQLMDGKPIANNTFTWNDAIIYSLMIDRFNDGNPENEAWQASRSVLLH